MDSIRKLTRVVILFVVFLATAVTIGCSEDDSEKAVFFDQETGQWVAEHPSTGALWLRCDIGQTWDDSNHKCDGESTQMNYLEAVEACPAGFTLPSNADFATVLCNYSEVGDECNGNAGYNACADCSICNSMFPEDDTDNYSTNYFSSDTYWIEEIGYYRCFEFEFWTGCVWEYSILGNDEENSVKCIKSNETPNSDGGQ